MGGHALTPPTHHRLGEPLPHQLANGTRAPPKARGPKIPRFPDKTLQLSHIRYYPGFPPAIPNFRAGRSRVTHPFAAILAPEGAFPLDLHVLNAPPMFALSQDQTLIKL